MTSNFGLWDDKLEFETKTLSFESNFSIDDFSPRRPPLYIVMDDRSSNVPLS
jgi:hypothetical protein